MPCFQSPMLLSPCRERFWVHIRYGPLSCSVVVRALASPALVDDPLSCPLEYEHLWVLRYFTTHPLSASHRHNNTRFSNSPRNKTGVLFIPWFLPGWYNINASRCFSEDAILRCVSVVTRRTSPLRMVLVFMCSRVCFFCISYIGFLQVVALR